MAVCLVTGRERVHVRRRPPNPEGGVVLSCDRPQSVYQNAREPPPSGIFRLSCGRGVIVNKYYKSQTDELFLTM